jgi:hypothetical protein
VSRIVGAGLTKTALTADVRILMNGPRKLTAWNNQAVEEVGMRNLALVSKKKRLSTFPFTCDSRIRLI